jgi:hypothetical protein
MTALASRRRRIPRSWWPATDQRPRYPRRPQAADDRDGATRTGRGLLDVSGARGRRGRARPVELTVVAQSDVRPWRYPPSQEFVYGEWLRDTYELGGAPQPESAPDLAILITMVLEGNAVLVGPPPAQLLDPVPHDDLIRGAAAGIPHLLSDLESDTRNVLLTLAGRRSKLGRSSRRMRLRRGRSASFRPSINRSSLEPEPCT